ncbi:glutaredoxin family protein [Dechloromonas agitata]|uniref:glutaredoxin family protein n=1 Tax=Dechloromonas agitata TaxID=73030 RepID=UPI0004865CEB|nr:glutaredoxin family protein [Dechloromonas agitata]
MSQRCPHCHYVRQPDDDAPDWQCPACTKAYAKAAAVPPPDGTNNARPRHSMGHQGGVGRWLLVLLAFGAALWFGRTLFPATAAPDGPAATGQPEVRLYATAWCGYCRLTRDFFAANGIQYVEHDIEQSSEALKEHRKLGGNGVPLIVVGDDVVKGWNEAALRRLLAPWLKG